MSHEKEIQQKIEQGREEDISISDLVSYKTVFNALTKEPSYALKQTFADRVLNALDIKQKRVNRLEYFWIAAGMMSLVIALIVTIVSVDFKPDLGFLKGIKAYRGVAIMAAFLLLIFQILDRKVIRPRHL